MRPLYPKCSISPDQLLLGNGIIVGWLALMGLQFRPYQMLGRYSQLVMKVGLDLEPALPCGEGRRCLDGKAG